MKPPTRRQFLAAALAAKAQAQPRRSVSIVPNFHPASCGWLTNFSRERVYCANSYFDHLDRVRDDPNYAFALSECNNLIAMLNFHPERTAELKRRIREGRVELVNAFFLESTINLSGGEALVRLGLEGLRWQQEVFGVRPRFAWCIDVCGTHEQMAQITAGLGLEAIVYSRKNPTGSGLHWLVSPDGTRTLALASGHYSDLPPIFGAPGALNPKQVEEVKKYLDTKQKTMPAGAPLIVLGGSGDYNLAPLRKENPSAFLKEWTTAEPATEIRFTTLSQYMDRVLPGIRSGATHLPELCGGTAYDFHSFWIENPRVKTSYRRSEHALQSAEMLASLASLQAKFAYPSQDLYHAWLQMFLNMDRNTLWGAAGGMVFEHDKSWDVRDRFESVAGIAAKVTQDAARSLAGAGEVPMLFNPLNWTRRDPAAYPSLPPLSLTPYHPATRTNPAPVPLPAVIDTRHYTARLDPHSGALLSLCPKPSGRELLGGPANVVVAEKPSKQSGDPGDHIQFRPDRVRLGTSSDTPVTISATQDAIALTVKVEGKLLGTPCTRLLRFYADYPRIDCETTLHDVPDRTVVVAEFPLQRDVVEERRGIPYGFAQGPGPKEIVPAVRWSHYAVAGGGFALLDQGLSGRERNGRTPVIYLLNASEKYYGYPNAWLSGQGEHVLHYALVGHDGEWKQARIPRLAWEYNCPPILLQGSAAQARSFVETSDNVIVESMRREAGFLELRLVECLGDAGEAEVKVTLPHRSVSLTNLVGGGAKLLSGGPTYRFAIRPQQIVTLRFRTPGKVAAVKTLREWDPLVPPQKRAALHEYSDAKGHPPRGN